MHFSHVPLRRSHRPAAVSRVSCYKATRTRVDSWSSRSGTALRHIRLRCGRFGRKRFAEVVNLLETAPVGQYYDTWTGPLTTASPMHGPGPTTSGTWRH